MKKLKYLVIHCSATPEGRDVKARQIIKMHTDPKPQGNGWRVPGYSKVIELDGTVVSLVGYNNDAWVQMDEVTNGAAGYNSESRHICYIGGVDKDLKPKDTRTAAQIKALEEYCIKMKKQHPDIIIIGHTDLNPNKACPSFNVKKWFKEVWERTSQ
jgi:N-acetylmuramoyl-L-alanine amidase